MTYPANKISGWEMPRAMIGSDKPSQDDWLCGPHGATRPFTVLLVKPYFNSPSNLFSPPLGILYLASVLRTHYGDLCQIRFLDMSLEGLQAEAIRPYIRKWQPDIIGISALNCEADQGRRIVEIAKQIRPEILAILGGPYALHNSKWIFDTSPVYDWVIEGTGERTLLRALDRYWQGEELGSDILGLSYRRSDGALKITTDTDLIYDLDDLPFPAWDLVDFDAYTSKSISMMGILKTKRYGVLFTSRGCPYLCNYCHDVFTKKFIYRSAENVVAEIAWLYENYGITEFQVVDDIFNLHKPRVKKIMEEVKKRWNGKMLFCFPNGLRGDILDDETIDALVDGGMYATGIAVETATPRLQVLTEKHLDTEKTFRAIQKLDERGVAVVGFFMLGFPTETPEEIENTIRFAMTAGLTSAYFFRVVPQPGAPIFELAAKENKRALDEITQIDLSGGGHYRTGESWYERAYGYPLDKVIRRASLRFFMRPQTLYRLFTRWPLFSILRTLPVFASVVLGIKLGWLRRREYERKKLSSSDGS